MPSLRQSQAESLNEAREVSCLPTPVLVLSHASCVVVANKACTELFAWPQSLLDVHIDDLPIKWQEGNLSTLEGLSTLAVGQDKDVRDDDDDGHHLPRTLLKLDVEIVKQQSSTSTEALLVVTGFVSKGSFFRLLSFENVKDVAPHQPTMRTDFSGQNRHAVPREPETRSYSGAISSSDKSQPEHYFSKLCDAIYHNDHRSGFLLSADETFCYPNYSSSQPAVAVEINDIELFFESWDAWDPCFQQKLPLSEYPSLWLNRHRTAFRNRRCGLVENGEKIVLDTSGDPLYDLSNGEFLGGVVWITRLGTFAEVATLDLEKSLSDFESICDRLPHLLWTVNSDGQADYFSQSWYDFTGFTQSQSLGLAFQNAIDPADMDNIWKSFHAAKVSKTEINCEARYRRHDGKWRWMNVRTKPLVDADGLVLKWYGSSTEIDNLVTERDRANDRKDQLMGMLTLADVGLFEALNTQSIKVLEGRVKWLDDKADFSHPTDTNGGIFGPIAKRLTAIIEGVQRELAFEVQIESRWYKIRLVLDVNPDNSRKVLGCSVDVTEQKERETLEVENQRLMHQTSLEIEKGRLKTMFLAHMSHEIRTPIAGIIGIADMLMESKLEDSQAECVSDVQFSANNLLTIVNDILDFSKIEADQLHFEEVQYDLIGVVLEVKKLFWRTARAKSLTMKYNFDKSACIQLTGDPGRVRQILSNLVSNAIKFTSEGSIEVSIETNPRHIRVIVQDQGQGIDDETMSRLFRPFVQGDASTARKYGGTGLGLTISRHLADRMGGKLELVSEVGKGSVATLTLARAVDKDKVETQERGGLVQTVSSKLPSLTVKSPDHTSENSYRVSDPPLVLVVEDNAINQKVAVNLVRKLGYQVQTAWDGLEALSYIERSLAARIVNDESDKTLAQKQDCTIPALILMDCQMPTLDGYETTKRLRCDPKFDLIKSVPVITLTASAIEGDREKCQAAGMDDYMSKPVTKAIFEIMLRTWIPATS